MMKNKKGLSTVVTTLIIVLLVLVAVGIIWGVVNNLLSKSKTSIETGTKCLDLDITAVKVINTTTSGDYDVTLRRGASGDDEEIYAKIVFYNDSTNTAVLDFTEGLTPLETNTLNMSTELLNANKVEITPYYMDDNGNDALCPAGTFVFKF